MSTVGNTALLPYGVTSSAPAITLPNVAEFKNDRTKNAEKYFLSEIEQLNEKYQKLVQLDNDCELVYSARYNFIPKVGMTYYLYWTGKDHLLSLIEHWSKYECVGAFKLTSDNVWKRVWD